MTTSASGLPSAPSTATSTTAVPAGARAGAGRPVGAAHAVAATRRRHMSRRTAARLSSDAALLLIAACFVVPLLWLLLSAFNSTAGLSLSWPHPWTFHNFRAVLNTDTTYRPLWNGFILCGGGTVIALVCAVLAAYPLSRFRSRWKRPFLLTVLFSTGLPITAIMVPVYGLFVRFDLIGTMSGAVLFMATTALPIDIWLMKNFTDGVPIELEEAAWTDGASSMQALRRIVLPLMWPGVSVVAIYTFIGLWGNFFVPFILLQSNDQLPASVSIYTFFSQYGTVVYGQLAAYSMIYSLPAVLLYLFLSKRLGGAFSFSGAVKG